jgi:hypothetical protein
MVAVIAWRNGVLSISYHALLYHVCRLSPTFEFGCDGASLGPLEVMFVKVKSHMLANEFTFSKKAAKYQQWQQQVRRYKQYRRLLCSRGLGCVYEQLAFIFATTLPQPVCHHDGDYVLRLEVPGCIFSGQCATAGSSHLLGSLCRA